MYSKWDSFLHCPVATSANLTCFLYFYIHCHYHPVGKNGCMWIWKRIWRKWIQPRQHFVFLPVSGIGKVMFLLWVSFYWKRQSCTKIWLCISQGRLWELLQQKKQNECKRQGLNSEIERWGRKGFMDYRNCWH